MKSCTSILNRVRLIGWSMFLSAKSCNPGSSPIGANLRKLSLKLSSPHLLRGPTAQQAPMYGVRKTCCSGTQIQTSTNNRGTMGPRNKCGDDKIGCIFSLKLAPVGSCPGQAFAGICSKRRSHRRLRFLGDEQGNVAPHLGNLLDQ